MKRWRMMMLVCLMLVGCFAPASLSHAATPSSHTPVPKGSFNTTAYAYYEYLPEGYSDDPNVQWPVVIYLHGIGQKDNGGGLASMLTDGLPKYIDEGEDYPFVVISPQVSGANINYFKPSDVDTVVEFVKMNYQVDSDRIYMTGISMGGGGVWLYAKSYPEKLAGMIPIAGNETTPSGDFSGIPTWAFHNWGDVQINSNRTINWVNDSAGDLLGTGPTDLLATHPMLNDPSYEPPGNNNDTDKTRTANFDIAGGWTWIDGVTRASGSHPTLTLYASKTHGGWYETYHNAAVWDWLLNQSLSGPIEEEELGQLTTLFNDAFDNGTAAWNAISGSLTNWSILTEGSDSVLAQPSTSGQYAVTAGDPSWTDYTVSVDVKRTGGQEAAILGRVTANDKFYQLHIDGSEWAVFKNHQNTWTELARGTYSTSISSYNNLQMTFQGDQIDVYIDGQYQGTAIDTTSSPKYTSGMIGLRTYLGSARFDDVLVQTGSGSPVIACDKTIPLDSTIEYFGTAGSGTQYLDAQPGDTVCIEAGQRGRLKLTGFEGSATNPITIINHGGLVDINHDRHAFIISGSKHFRVTGTGDPAYPYGIKVNSHTNSEHAVVVGSKSTNYELDHLEVTATNGGFAGLFLRSNMACDTRDGVFTQYDTLIHDNYIHDTGGEGIYLGQTTYLNGGQATCDGQAMTIYPHRFDGLRIYNNLVEDTDWDAIQLTAASTDVEVYGNTIRRYGQANNSTHSHGFEINPGTRGKFYGNWVEDGYGAAFHNQGLAGTEIYNNVIIDAGTDGIYSQDGLRTGDPYNTNDGMHFWNNTIINSGANGIFAKNHQSGPHTIYNNLIVDTTPGSSPGIYISGTGWTSDDNLIYTSMTTPQFVGTSQAQYELSAGSPAVDTGRDLTSEGVIKDFNGDPRPKGQAYDIGAYESH